ncbi:MAG: P-II family nitrogen regulator [Spirochaetales bacterium]|uniref:P-II family nitrogen regulator n=1 Tax=Candidatus Thalassospirochaeta sargassi TaxID=3119039 RepID=A0AAJ1MKH4_9SPIO|nr:P-II family nitrogen regulator [Spirochaetales bacterium]
MIMVRAIMRPERTQEVIDSLLEAGYPAVTKIDVAGRGRQLGIKVGEVQYDELPKEMVLMVVPEGDKDVILKTILDNAKTPPSGAMGDGKIFISPVEESYTISSGFKES